jgi:hypothetical protein
MNELFQDDVVLMGPTKYFYVNCTIRDGRDLWDEGDKVRGKASRKINRDKNLIKQNPNFNLEKTPKSFKETKIKTIGSKLLSPSGIRAQTTSSL